jgi:hypothetical protein
MYYDMNNTQKSWRGAPVTNLLPNPTINSVPTTGNGWGTYNTNQYGSGAYFSIGTVSSISSNIVTMTAAHSLRSYDVMQPQSSGGGVTGGIILFLFGQKLLMRLRWVNIFLTKFITMELPLLPATVLMPCLDQLACGLNIQ